MSLPSGISRANEELGAVGVGPCVGHGQSAHAHVLQGEVFISKLLAVDRLASSAIVVGAVSPVYLAHEAWNDTVEAGTLVTEALLASAQGPEVLCKQFMETSR
uniref:Uncharacterized protein n=1 Tax=Electrophorus electricus TaxID=8005 RepID=A0A4W4H6R0_ELEEL